MNKGQITTIDFLISMSLVIFCIGAIMGFAELQTYKIKSEIKESVLAEKAEAALIVLASGTETGCQKGDHNLAYSFDMNPAGMNKEVLKKILGVNPSEDYNINLKVGSATIIDNQMNGKNIVTFDINLLVCNSLSSSRPVSLWHFDEGTGLTANDEPGSNDLSISGATTWTSGKDGNALVFINFEGMASKIKPTNLPTGNSSRTLSIWIKPNAIGTLQGIMGYGSITPNKLFALYISPGGKFALNTGNPLEEFGEAISIGKWHYVTITYENNGAAKAYINGVLKREGTYVSPLETADDILAVGYQLSGITDEAAIWDRALSKEEVYALYSTGLYRLSKETAVLRVGK